MGTTGDSRSRRTRARLCIAAVTALTATACGSGGSSDAGSTPSSADASSSSAHPTDAAWGYDHGLEPADWGTSYPDCADSDDAKESPIDVPTTSPGAIDKAEPVELALKPTYWRVFNNGHTVEAAPVTAAGEPAEGSAGAIEIAGKDYEVAQFHFHAPSEHTRGGAHTALEMHVVGKSSDGAVTVLGLQMTVGAANTAIQPIFEAMPTKVSEEEEGTLLTSAFDLSKVLPTGVETLRYQGSLTTPPCTGGVLWDLYLKPITISAAEAKDFTDKYSNDDRPTQPLHGRILSLRYAEAVQ